MISMGKYTSAFDKIRVTPDMENRIAANLEKESIRIAETPQRAQMTQREMNRLMGKMPHSGQIQQQGVYAFLKQSRLVYAIAACCVLVISAAVFYSPLIHRGDPDPVAGVVNPYKAYGSIDELKNALPFELVVPSKIPPQFIIEGIDSIGGKIAQIRYSDGNETITFRAASGTEDISGDSNEYAANETKTVSGMKVTLKGNSNLVYLSIWTDDTRSYSLSTSQGMSEELVLEIIQSLHQ
jgi:hypothetical protein